MTIHKGGCHCGKVRFEVTAPKDIAVTKCNCSIWTISRHTHSTPALRGTVSAGIAESSHITCLGHIPMVSPLTQTASIRIL